MPGIFFENVRVPLVGRLVSAGQLAAAAQLADQAVHWLQGSHPERKEVPGAKELGQELRPLVLDGADGDYGCEDDAAGDENGEEGDGSADDGQGEDGGGGQEEHGGQVGEGEPAVLGRSSAEGLAHGERPEHVGGRVEEEDAGEVEAHVALRNREREKEEQNGMRRPLNTERRITEQCCV